MSREVNSKKALFIKLILMAVLQLLLKLPGTIHPKLESWLTVISPKVKQTKTAS